VFGLLTVLLGFVGLTFLLQLVARLLRVPIATSLLGDVAWLPAHWAAPSDEGEPVWLATPDGFRLFGRYTPTPAFRRRGVIAFCHDLNGDLWTARLYTRELSRRGFDVFAFDFRHHGASDRHAGYQPTPWVSQYEVIDVRTVIDYLSSRPDADPNGIGLIGINRGGTAALCAAAGDPRVAALVVDGPVPTERLQIQTARRLLRRCFLPARLVRELPEALLALLGTWAKWVIGYHYHCQLVNVDQAARHVTQPVLLIHGRHETYVSPEVVREFRAEIAGSAKIWTIPRGIPGRAVTAVPNAYHRRIVRFFASQLDRPLPVHRPQLSVRAPLGLDRTPTPLAAPVVSPVIAFRGLPRE